MGKKYESKTIAFTESFWSEIDKYIATINAKKPGTYRGRAQFLEKAAKEALSGIIPSPKETVRGEITMSHGYLDDLEKAAVLDNHKLLIAQIRRSLTIIKTQLDKLYE